MKPKHQRLAFILFSVGFLCAATLLALQAFRDNIVFFYTPTELSELADASPSLVRIGGLVESGSVKQNGKHLMFSLTDGKTALLIEHEGLPPALFREGQGAVVEGRLTHPGHFKAARVLTKHDEFYMPKEVVDSLKKTGHWHER